MLTWHQMIFRLVEEVKILADITKLTQPCEHDNHLNFCMAKTWWHGCVELSLETPFGFAKVALYARADGKTLRQKLKFNLVHQFCENRVKILDSSMQTKCLVKFFSWSKIPLMPCEDSVMKKGNWDYHVTLNFAKICSLSYNFLL